MDSKIINEKPSDADRMDFLNTDIIMLKAQLEAGNKIIGVVLPFQDHKTAPGLVGYRASTTYHKMDALDIQALTDRLKKQETELARLNAKRIVNFKIDENNKEEKNIKKNPPKKDS